MKLLPLVLTLWLLTIYSALLGFFAAEWVIGARTDLQPIVSEQLNALAVAVGGVLGFLGRSLPNSPR